MKLKLTQSLFFLWLFTYEAFAVTEGDSAAYQNFSIGYYMLNDNDPISNQKGYDARNRDDHGLTFMLQFNAEAKLNLFKNTQTTLRYENYCGLFTRGFGTLTKLPKTDPDYEYFSYILKVHPDWDNILLYDQVAITKNANTFNISNQTKNIVYGLGIRQVAIDADYNQRGTRIQQQFHKTLEVRNFYHKSFTDSSVFKGTSLSYMAASLFGGYYKRFDIKPKFNVIAAPLLGFWYNATNQYTLHSFSPFIKINLMAGIGKTIFADSKRFNVGYQFYLEPMERLQLYSDPGTQGNNALSLDINFGGKKAAQLEQCNTWFMLYKLNLCSMHMPFGKISDSILNYKAGTGDKGNLLGFINFSVAMVLK